MAGLTDLIAEIGNENIEYQQLSQSMTSVKSNNAYGDCEVTFATGKDKMNGQKEGVVIWVDKGLFDASLEKMRIQNT